jgi:hypothetical protein
MEDLVSVHGKLSRTIQAQEAGSGNLKAIIHGTPWACQYDIRFTFMVSCKFSDLAGDTQAKTNTTEKTTMVSSLVIPTKGRTLGTANSRNSLLRLLPLSHDPKSYLVCGTELFSFSLATPLS